MITAPFMRRLADSFIHRCRVASPAALVVLVITTLLLLAYRVDVHRLIQVSYPELSQLTFGEFLAASAKGDATMVLLVSLVSWALLAAAANSRRLLYSISVCVLSVQAIFFGLAVNFFGIYEAPLTREFLGEGLAPDLRSSFASFSAELAPAMWTRIGLALIIPALFAELLMRWHRARARQPNAWTLRGSAAALVVLAVLAVRPSQAASPTVADLSLNPMVGVLVAQTPAPLPPVVASATAAAPKAKFAWRFDTTSKAVKAKHDGLGLPKKKYNMILYFIESTAAQYVGTELNGKKVTPVLDGLRASSAVFPKHYANYPLSANAMLNVMMSAYSQNGKKPIVQEHSYIGLSSLPQELKAAGYRTYLTSTGMLGYANQDKYLSVRSIDRIEDMPVIKAPPYTEWVGWGLDDRAMIKPTLKFIAEDKTAPFFIAMFPVAPHHPYAIPDKSFSLGEISKDLDVKTRVKLKYHDSLHYSDYVIGELIKALEKAGAMENTLLFIFADHGEAFYQHEKNYNHPLCLYEENVRVPFLIYNKDLFKKGSEYAGVSRHVDILPTILDLAGLPPMKTAEGISLASPHEEQLSVMHTNYKDDLNAVRDGNWKYIVRTKDQREELYDLSKDPLEKTNVVADNPEVAATYREVTTKLREHRDVYYRKALKDFPLHTAPADAGVAAAGELPDGGL